MSKEQEEQPQPSPNPTDYESWNEGFKVGVDAGFKKAKELYSFKLTLRTVAASVAGVYFIGMLVQAFGVGFFALLGGAALTAFFFYVLDQTEEAIKQGFKKLSAWNKERKLKKEKKDGNSSGDSNS